MNKIAEALQAPFLLHEYEWRVQQENKAGDKVMVLCYVTSRAIQDRLDEVFGPLGWTVSYAPGPDKGVMCTVSAWDAEAKQWVSKSDGAENTQVEAVKGGYSAACKRAGVVWGIGRLLYRLDANWVTLQDKGTHWHRSKDGTSKYWDDPELPKWAVRGDAPPPKTQPAPRTATATKASTAKAKPAARKPAPATEPTNRKEAYLAACARHGCGLATKPENYYICTQLLKTDFAKQSAEKYDIEPKELTIISFTETTLPPETDIIWTILKDALDGKAAEGSLAMLVADAQEVAA